MLLGLLAVMIPIAVHLFNFRKYRKLYFSNVQFLKELKQQTRKQSNLLHRLVLLFRILAFLFIVLAFAQPFFAKEDISAMRKSNIVSIYVDNSFSMEAQGTRGTLLDEAKDKAAEAVAAYKQDDLFQLLTNDFEGQHQRLVSSDEFLTMLNDVEVSSPVRSLAEISARQHDLLSSNRKENAIVHYISDFQSSTIMKALPDSGISNGYLIPLKPASGNNLFIDTCWFSNPVLQINEPVTLNVRITNVSDIMLEKIPVRLMIEGIQRSVASIDIEAGKSKDVSFTFSNNKAGNLAGYAEINDFPVTYDDIYYFTFRISPALPVLSINDEATDQYITSVFSVDSIIQLTNTTARQIDFSSLSSFRLIILNGLTSLSTGLIQEINKFTVNGGSVVYIPSLESSTETHNLLLISLGTDNFTELDEKAVKLAKVNVNHPVYREVFEQGTLKAENINMPLINRHYSIRQSSVSNSETLLELENGQPLLTVTPSGKGTVYVFATALNDESGNFVRHALFVPTMLNIAFRSEKISPLMHYTDSRNPIAISGIHNKSDNVIKISGEAGQSEFIPEFRQINAQNFIFINGQIKEAGIYSVQSENKELDLLAFNYNRNESDLRIATTEELEKIEAQTGYNIIESSPKPLNELIKKQTGEKWWKWFIVGALMSLVIETLLLAFYRRKTATV
jgi:hypothetical protein